LEEHDKKIGMHRTYELTSEVQTSGMGRVSTTLLRGRWLLLARLVWLVVAALCFGLFLLSLPPYAAQLHMVCTTVTAASCPLGGLGPAGVRALQDLALSVEGYV
jgi:hypothetical protein